jgi:hypothetical protein
MLHARVAVAILILALMAVDLHPNLTHYPRIFASNFDPRIMPEDPENTGSAWVNY